MIKYFECLGKEDAATTVFQKGFKTPGELKLRFLDSVSCMSLCLEEGVLGICLGKLFML